MGKPPPEANLQMRIVMSNFFRQEFLYIAIYTIYFASWRKFERWDFEKKKNDGLSGLAFFGFQGSGLRVRLEHRTRVGMRPECAVFVN